MSGGTINPVYQRRGGRIRWHLMEAGIAIASGWATNKREARTDAGKAKREAYHHKEKA